MSLLADVLSRLRQTQNARDVPPNLKSIVQSSALNSARRKKIFLMAGLFFASVSAGLFSVYAVKSLAKRSISTPSVTLSEASVSHDATPPAGKTGRADTAVTEPVKDTAEHIPDKGGDDAVTDDTNEYSQATAAPAGDSYDFAQQDNTPDVPLLTKNAAAPAEQGQAGQDSISESSEPDAENEAPSRPFSPVSSREAAIDRHLYNARTSMNKRDYSGALEAYRAALDMGGRNAPVLNSTAYACLMMSRPGEAIVYARQALEIQKDYVPALINMGIAHARLGTPEAAKKHLAEALLLEPDNQSALLNMAVLNEQQGVLQEASDSYARLGGLGNAGGLMGLARVHEKQGHAEEAIVLYRRLSALETADPAVRLRARQRMVLLLESGQ